MNDNNNNNNNNQSIIAQEKIRAAKKWRTFQKWILNIYSVAEGWESMFAKTTTLNFKVVDVNNTHFDV